MSRLLAALAYYQCDEPNPSRLTGKIRCPHPDHEERRASCSYDLTISDGVLNCFGCQFQGDAINLIMAREGIGAQAAIEFCKSIIGAGDDASRAEPERRSPISGKPGYKPKYRRDLPSRTRHFGRPE